jgi:hypothetical protein
VLECNGTKLGRCEGFECAIEGANRRPGRSDDDNFTRDGRLPNYFSELFMGLDRKAKYHCADEMRAGNEAGGKGSREQHGEMRVFIYRNTSTSKFAACSDATRSETANPDTIVVVRQLSE